MSDKKNRNINYQHVETIIHIVFWLLLFMSVNVNWTDNWFDKSLRPKNPAPLIVIAFPIFCYVNAHWLIPKYLNREKWMWYVFFAFLLFFVPEFIRSGILSQLDPNLDFFTEIQSRDSLLFGSPSPFVLAIYSSFGYRFTKDWFLNRQKIEHLKKEAAAPKKPIGRQQIVIPAQEAKVTLAQLKDVVASQKPYLNPELTLRDLAKMAGTTDKKLSFVLNEHLKLKFNDYVNQFRVEAFKEAAAKEENKNLSLVGIAKECGFKSKSSFYRAFKNQTGQSPTEYLKRNS